ncbi:MAG: DUF4124 domain-containing protein [Pseudomonadota bacterium]
MYERPLFALILLTVLFLALPVYSEIHRWIDDEGQIHYTEMPPTKGKSDIFVPTPSPKLTHSPNDDSPQRPKDPDLKSQDIETPNRQQQTTKETKQKRKKNCTAATENMNKLQSHGRIKMLDGGSYRILSTEERETKINEARKLIEQNCN